MKLDNRLQTIADFVESSQRLLDVGTDHGYLCAYLVKNKIAKEGIASDVSQGSLSKAVELIKKENMENFVECRLGSGLKVINENDKVDTIVIAGMGGILISEILEEDKSLITTTKPRLILQPVQRPEILRRYLIENLYTIMDEALIEAEGKPYNIIVAKYTGNKDDSYEEKYFEVGKYHRKRDEKVYGKHLDFLINKYEVILLSMMKSDKIESVMVEDKKRYIEFLRELKNEIKRD